MSECALKRTHEAHMKEPPVEGGGTAHQMWPDLFVCVAARAMLRFCSYTIVEHL